MKRLTVRERPGIHRFRYWQEGGGYDRNPRSVKALEAAIAYIHENPVRRQLRERSTDWRWSSTNQTDKRKARSNSLRQFTDYLRTSSCRLPQVVEGMKTLVEYDQWHPEMFISATRRMCWGSNSIRNQGEGPKSPIIERKQFPSRNDRTPVNDDIYECGTRKFARLVGIVSTQVPSQNSILIQCLTPTSGHQEKNQVGPRYAGFHRS